MNRDKGWDHMVLAGMNHVKDFTKLQVGSHLIMNGFKLGHVLRIKQPHNSRNTQGITSKAFDVTWEVAIICPDVMFSGSALINDRYDGLYNSGDSHDNLQGGPRAERYK